MPDLQREQFTRGGVTVELKELYQHIFQAFSALSDAQELLASSRVRGTNDLVNHAKRHLLAIIRADEPGYTQAMLDLPITCTLAEGEGL